MKIKSRLFSIGFSVVIIFLLLVQILYPNNPLSLKKISEYFNKAAVGVTTQLNIGSAQSNIGFLGNVGVGTTLPLKALDIDKTGSTRLRIAGTSGYVGIDFEGETGDQGIYLGVGTAGRIVTIWNNAERLSVTKDGNVGVGTTDPNQKLSIVGNAEAGTNYGGQFPSFDGGGFIIGDEGAITDYNTNALNLWSRGDFNLYSNSEVDKTTPEVLIKESGIIGIGTTSPGSHLHVQNISDAAWIRVDGASDGFNYSGIGLKTYGLADNKYWFLTLNANSSYGLHFYYRDLALMNSYQPVKFYPATKNEVLVVRGDTGNVGIGTATPGQNLDVLNLSDHARFGVRTGTDNKVAQLKLTARNTSDYNWHISNRGGYDSPNNRLAINNNTPSERFTITQEGNVGINYTTPVAKLHVATGPIYGQGLLETATNAPSTAGNAEFQTYKTTGSNWAGIGGYTSGGMWFRGEGITFWSASTYNPSPPPTLHIAPDNVGNVGIGTTTPEKDLHVKNNSSAGANVLLESGDGNKWHIVSNYSSNRFGIVQTGVTERLTVSANGGNVGIGTQTPVTKLHVEGGALVGSSTNRTAIGLSIPMGDKGLQMEYNTGGDFYWMQALHQGTAYKNLILQADGGNVGIGTTSPTNKLEVSGSLKITGGVNFLGISLGTTDNSLCMSSTGWVYYVGSDSCRLVSTLRDKHNITNVNTIGLEEILKINPVTFVRNSDKTNTLQLGFIAEQVASVNPLFASYNNETGLPSGLSDNGILAAVVQSIKDIDNKINHTNSLFNNLNLDKSGQLLIKTENEKYVVENTQNNQLINKIAAFAIIVVGKVKAGIVETQKLIVDSVDVMKKIQELSEKDDRQKKEIIELKKQIQELTKK